MLSRYYSYWETKYFTSTIISTDIALYYIELGVLKVLQYSNYKPLLLHKLIVDICGLLNLPRQTIILYDTMQSTYQ